MGRKDKPGIKAARLAGWPQLHAGLIQLTGFAAYQPNCQRGCSTQRPCNLSLSLSLSPCGFQSCANIRVCFDRQADGPGDRYRTAQDAAWPTEQCQPFSLSRSLLLSAGHNNVWAAVWTVNSRAGHSFEGPKPTAALQLCRTDYEFDSIPAAAACPAGMPANPGLPASPSLPANPALPAPFACLPTLACLPALAMYNKLFASAPG